MPIAHAVTTANPRPPVPRCRQSRATPAAPRVALRTCRSAGTALAGDTPCTRRATRPVRPLCRKIDPLMSGYHLLSRLDAEWRHLARAPASRAALRRWAQQEPALAGCHDLQQLHAEGQDRYQPERADRRLAALVRLGAVDGGNDLLATRTVLQLLLPGAVRLAHSVKPMISEPGAELPVVLGELTLGVRTFPWRRRTRMIAANLLLDARQRITRGHQRLRRETTTGLDPHLCPPAVPDSHAVADLHDLVEWAIRTGAIDDFEARLLVAWHVAELPVPTLVTTFGKCRSTLFQLRAAAESKLRSALVRCPDPKRARAAAGSAARCGHVVTPSRDRRSRSSHPQPADRRETDAAGEGVPGAAGPPDPRPGLRKG